MKQIAIDATAHDSLYFEVPDDWTLAQIEAECDRLFDLWMESKETCDTAGKGGEWDWQDDTCPFNEEGEMQDDSSIE